MKAPPCQCLASPPTALAEIFKQLDSRPIASPEQLLARATSTDKALKELLSYCSTIPEVKKIIDEFKVSAEEFKSCYWKLMATGAGQWAGSHWVAASSLAHAHTLRYVLKGKSAGHSDLEIMARLCEHFRHGGTFPTDEL
jgi:hypothetical protein